MHAYNLNKENIMILILFIILYSKFFETNININIVKLELYKRI